MGANGERRNVNSNRQDLGSRVITEIALGRAELAILVFTIFVFSTTYVYCTLCPGCHYNLRLLHPVPDASTTYVHVYCTLCPGCHYNLRLLHPLSRMPVQLTYMYTAPLSLQLTYTALFVLVFSTTSDTATFVVGAIATYVCCTLFQGMRILGYNNPDNFQHQADLNNPDHCRRHRTTCGRIYRTNQGDTLK
jgi:hypothetical protein